MMEKIRFDSSFSFKYSEREGTTAAKLNDKISECVKRDRLQIVQELQDRHTLERNRATIGNKEDILVEGVSKNSPRDLTGRTRTNKIVNFEGNYELIGKTVSVIIIDAYLHSLRGELTKEEVH